MPWVEFRSVVLGTSTADTRRSALFQGWMGIDAGAVKQGSANHGTYYFGTVAAAAGDHQGRGANSRRQTLLLLARRERWRTCPWPWPAIKPTMALQGFRKSSPPGRCSVCSAESVLRRQRCLVQSSRRRIGPYRPSRQAPPAYSR